MTSTLKLYGSIALMVIFGLVVWGVISWDNNRLEAAFNEGVESERALWVTAAANANSKAAAEGNTKTLISEAVSDQSNEQASKIIAANTAASNSIVEKLTHAYDAAPPVTCISADPQPLPPGVLQGLSEARSAALGQTSTTTGGLQPTQRSRSTTAPNSR